jgi:Family of unknown function (DUF6599)
MIKVVFMLQILFVTNFSTISTKIFPDIEGLIKDGEVDVYDSNNLYDYINGAADSYLSYDFVELTLQRYKGSNNQSLKIEIYEHSNENTGFGIYSSERPSKGNWLEVGNQGYYEKGILNFYKNRFYIKIMTYGIENSKDVLINTANLISENLDGEKKTISAIELFPDVGKKVNSEKYIHNNFLGYEPLNGVFTVEYEIDENYFEMFLIEKGNAQICRQMIEDYFRSVKLDSTKIDEGKMLINDPYQGDFYVIWKKNILIGVINYSNAKLAEQYLDLMDENLKNRH